MGPLQEAWVKALESGEYQQGDRRLVTVVNPGPDEELKCCCLGVLCLVEGLEKHLDMASGGMEPRYHFEREQFYLPQSLVQKYGFYNHRGQAMGAEHPDDKSNSLSYMNDSGRSFAEIAAYVREHPTWFFSKEV